MKSGKLANNPSFFPRTNSDRNMGKHQQSSKQAEARALSVSAERLPIAKAAVRDRLYSFQEGDLVFSVYMKVPVKRIKSNEVDILPVNEGDLVRVLCQLTLDNTNVMVEANGEKGYIMSSALSIDGHTRNLYLEAVDIFIDQPDLMVDITNKHYPSYPYLNRTMIKMLCARRILDKVLKKLLQQELDATIQKNEFLREGSPVIVLIRNIIGDHEKDDAAITPIHKFKKDFKDLVIKNSGSKVTKQYFKSKKIKPENILNLIDVVLNFLRDQVTAGFPIELVAIMKALRKALTESKMPKEEVSKFLGSILFLRLINVELTKMSAQDLPHLKMVAIALQCMSNRVDPTQKYPEIYPLIDELRNRQEVVANLLGDIIISDSKSMPDELLLESALFYRFISKNFSERPEVIALQKSLGVVPAANVNDEEYLPLSRKIAGVAEYISQIESATSTPRTRLKR